MANYHLQLFASRFNEVAEDYLQRVNWIYEGIAPEIAHLMQAIDLLCSKEQVRKQQWLVFDDTESQRDILSFYNPIQCCEKSLLNSDTLIVHIMSHGDGRDELDSRTKEMAILFNLYVQIGTGIFERYDNGYDQIEQFTVQHLRKASEFLGCILRKPVRRDASAADTFLQNPTFGKWKYVFDYTCGTCTDTGIDNCRYMGAIAWFKIHQHTMVANSIRHLGTKMHAKNLLACGPVHNVAPPPATLRAPRNQVAEGFQGLSAAGKYLLEVRGSELDKLCAIGRTVMRSTPYEAVNTYLKAKILPRLKMMVLQPFGSRVTGVANHDSDIDLVITAGEMHSKTAYNKVLAWARDNPKEVEILRKIPEGPRVLRLKIFSLKVTVDLTFDSPYVVANSAVVEYFFRMQPMARKLFFLLKEWKKRTDISENFHNNVLTTMIVFYMLTEEYLPRILPRIDNPQRVYIVCNTDLSLLNVNYPLYLASFMELVQGFFDYWARFDWAQTGASVRESRVRPKSFFSLGARQQMPPMVLTDYFDTSRNVAGNVNTKDFRIFVQACEKAANVLKTRRNI